MPATRAPLEEKFFRLHNIQAKIVARWLRESEDKIPMPPQVTPASGNWPAYTFYAELPRLPGNGHGPLDLKLPEGIESVRADEKTNQLRVLGTAQGLAALEALLPPMDVALVQYEVEARFYEIQKADLPALGLKFWNPNPKGNFGSVIVAPDDWEARFAKLETQKRARVLTAPEITLIDGLRGELKSTRSQPMVFDPKVNRETAAALRGDSNVNSLGMAFLHHRIGVAVKVVRHEFKAISLDVEANLTDLHAQASVTMLENQTMALQLTPASEKRQIVVIITAQRVRREGDTF